MCILFSCRKCNRCVCVLMYCFFIDWLSSQDSTVEIAFIPGKGLFPSSTSLHNGIQRAAGNNYNSGRLKVHIRSPEVSWFIYLFIYLQEGWKKINWQAGYLLLCMSMHSDREEFVLNNCIILTYYFVWQLTKASTLISTMWCTTVHEWFLFILLNFQEIVLSVLLRSLSAFEISLQHYIICLFFFLQICTEEPASVSSPSPDICPPDIQISGRPPLILPHTPSFLCIKPQLLFCLCYWMRAEWDRVD